MSWLGCSHHGSMRTGENCVLSRSTRRRYAEWSRPIAVVAVTVAVSFTRSPSGKPTRSVGPPQPPEDRKRAGSSVPPIPCLSRRSPEGMTGIERALSALESDRSGPLIALTWESGVPLGPLYSPTPRANDLSMSCSLIVPGTDQRGLLWCLG